MSGTVEDLVIGEFILGEYAMSGEEIPLLLPVLWVVFYALMMPGDDIIWEAEHAMVEDDSDDSVLCLEVVVVGKAVCQPVCLCPRSQVRWECLSREVVVVEWWGRCYSASCLMCVLPTPSDYSIPVLFLEEAYHAFFFLPGEW